MSLRRIAVALACVAFAGCGGGNTPTAPASPGGPPSVGVKSADVKPEAGKRGTKSTNTPVGAVD